MSHTGWLDLNQLLDSLLEDTRNLCRSAVEPGVECERLTLACRQQLDQLQGLNPADPAWWQEPSNNGKPGTSRRQVLLDKLSTLEAHTHQALTAVKEARERVRIEMSDLRDTRKGIRAYLGAR